MIGRTVGHYRILERLGGGGMGVVYKAEDLTLDRTVALKFLPPELTRDDDAKKRFLIEAKATAKLDHPNICNVYDVAEWDDGQSFIAMAYYEGESLAKRLESGALPVEEAARIAIEVARGLGAAHQAGIIHRDIKPANVMLTAKGDVKIVDFGVAKLTGVTMTHGGGSPGTLAYMAPEQIRGEPVTPSTDLWALGAVFYEMLTGARPFRGDYEQAVAYTILNESPVPLDQTLPACPPALRETIERALTKDSTKRFRTADEFVAAVESISAARAVVVPTNRPRANFRPVAIVTALLAIGAVAAGYLLLRERSPAGEILPIPPVVEAAAQPSRPRVAVALFENRTGDASLDPVGRMAADWISEGLARISAIEVVTTATVFELSRDAKPVLTTRALGAATGATLVVAGSFYLQDQTLTFQTGITEVSKGTITIPIERLSGDRNRPMDVVEALRVKVVDAFAAKFLDETANMLQEEGRPPAFEAYKEFLAGAANVHTDEALAHYRRAIELDPEFVKPRLFLVMEHLDALRSAEADRELVVVEAKLTRLTPVNQFRAKRLRAYLEGNYEATFIAQREVVRLMPSDPSENWALALDLSWLNRPRELLDVLGKPIRWELITGRGPSLEGQLYYLLMAGAFHALGDHSAEIQTMRDARARFGDEHFRLGSEARGHAAQGSFDELEALIREASRVNVGEGSVPVEAIVMVEAALELRAHGHRAESLAMWNRAEARFRDAARSDPSSRLRPWLARCLYGAERWGEAEREYRELAKADPESVTYQGTLGELAARRGSIDEADRVARALATLGRPYLFGENTYWRARIAAQSGRRDEAITLLQRAIAEGITGYGTTMPGYSGYANLMHDDVAFDPLRGDARFLELMKPKK